MAGSENFKRAWKLGIAAALSLSSICAATPAIGVASAFGTFTVDSVRVEGNSNLFDGSQIQTGLASSQLYLQSGTALTLGTNSSGIVYKDHIVLRQGAAKVEKMGAYSIEAEDYRLQPVQPAAQAIVRLNGSIVEVAALNGSLDVFNRQGALLTRIGAGTASAFQKQNPSQQNPPQQNPPNTGQTGATAGQSGATAGQTGATAGQSGATAETGASGRRKTALYVALGASLGGLGLAVDAILQPAPTSP